MSVKSDKIVYKNINSYSSTSNGKLLSLPEDGVSSKVTKWLAHRKSSQNISCITDIEQNFHTELLSARSASNIKKYKNRISVHNTPSLKPRTTWGWDNEPNSDDSSKENEDLDEKTIILAKEDFPILQNDEVHSPLQAWLKQELVSATNNSVIKSQETTKSVIVCAAKTKDVIISVGCSHMTCEFCYPQSTDLLLGYS